MLVKGVPTRQCARNANCYLVSIGKGFPLHGALFSLIDDVFLLGSIKHVCLTVECTVGFPEMVLVHWE